MMERLTNKNHKELGFCAYVGAQNPFKTPLTIGELAGCLNADYSPRNILEDILGRLAAYEDAMPLERAQELARAEGDGRLVVLPFCAKALLYEATEKGIREYEVEQFSIGVEELLIHATDKCIWYRGGRIFGQEQIGKIVFLTREEAEAALKKRGAREIETN